MGDTEPTTPLGQLLQRLRTEQGLSLYELANRSGLNRSTLMRWEDGSRKSPTTDALNRLAVALQIEVEELYDAVWTDGDAPLPSPAVYFRQKLALTDQQIRDLEQAVQRITNEDNESSQPERRS